MSEHKPSNEVQGIVCQPPRQDCIVAQIWGRVQNNFCSIKGSQKHVVYVNLNGRSLKQPELLELACWPNWVADGDGPWLDWWPRTRSSSILSLILRGNAHMSNNYLRILLLGATLGTKIFHEYGPRTIIHRFYSQWWMINGIWPLRSSSF